MPTIKCPSCYQGNDDTARYCIQCGSILKRIFCSACGMANPDGLETCLECGNSLPTLMDIRWAPTARIIQPTDAMIDRNIEQADEQAQRSSLLSYVCSRLRRRRN